MSVHSHKVDIVAYDDEQYPRLLVEAMMHEEMRAGLRQLQAYAAAHAGPHAPMLMLATPKKIYLWTRLPEKDDGAPEYVQDAEPYLRPIAEGLGLDYSDLPPGFSENLVAIWLEQITAKARGRELMQGDWAWIRESGLAELLAKTFVAVELRLEPVH